MRSAFTTEHGYEMLLTFERDRKAAGVEAKEAPKRKQRAQPPQAKKSKVAKKGLEREHEGGQASQSSWR